MTDATPRFALPLLAAGQAQKELFHNEALTLPDPTCAVLRARVGVGESAAIYVNCALPPG